MKQLLLSLVTFTCVYCKGQCRTDTSFLVRPDLDIYKSVFVNWSGNFSLHGKLTISKIDSTVLYENVDPVGNIFPKKSYFFKIDKVNGNKDFALITFQDRKGFDTGDTLLISKCTYVFIGVKDFAYKTVFAQVVK